VDWAIKEADLKVSGKRKKGTFTFHANSLICTIQCTDKTRYEVQYGVSAKVVEVNSTFAKHCPQRASIEGFIAVMLIKHKNLRLMQEETHLTFTEYVKLRGLSLQQHPLVAEREEQTLKRKVRRKKLLDQNYELRRIAREKREAADLEATAAVAAAERKSNSSSSSSSSQATPMEL
jgi:hypothetical protein